MYFKALYYFVIANLVFIHCGVACNLTKIELRALNSLEQSDSPLHLTTAEKLRSGGELNPEEQKLLQIHYERMLGEQLSELKEIAFETKAKGLCLARSKTMMDVLDDVNPAVALEKNENLRIANTDAFGRDASDPVIFSTLDGYNVKINGTDLSEHTNSLIRNKGARWFTRTKAQDIIKTFRKNNVSEREIDLIFQRHIADGVSGGQISWEELTLQIQSLGHRQSALVSMNSLVTFPADAKIFYDTGHALLLHRYQNIVYIFENLGSPISKDTFLTFRSFTLSDIAEAESPTQFIKNQITEGQRFSIQELQDVLTYNENKLSSLEQSGEGHSPSEIQKVISKIDSIKKLLANKGIVGDPHATFDVDAFYLSIITRSKQ